MIVDLPIVTGTHQVPEDTLLTTSGVRRGRLENLVPLVDIDGSIYLQQMAGIRQIHQAVSSGTRYGRGICVYSNTSGSGLGDNIAYIIDNTLYLYTNFTGNPSSPATVNSAINTTSGGRIRMKNFQEGANSTVVWGNHRNDAKGVGTYDPATDTQDISAVIGTGFIQPVNYSSTTIGSPRTIDFINRQLVGEDTLSWASSAPASTQLDTTNRIAESEAKPDRIVGVAVVGPYLYVLNYYSIEVYQNTGSGKPPFSRLPVGVIGRGVLGDPFYVVDEEENAIYFIDHARTPCRLVGTQVQELGNPYLHSYFLQSSILNSVFGSMFIIKVFGAKGICICPVANTSSVATDILVYWPHVGLWSNLKDYPIYDTAIVTNQGTADATYCLGSRTGYLYRLDDNAGQNDFSGNGTTWVLETPYVNGRNVGGQAGQYVYHNKITIMVSARESTPVADFTLEFNDSHGAGSWTDCGTPSVISEISGSTLQLSWSALGRSTNRVYRLTYNSSIPYTRQASVKSMSGDLSIGPLS